MRRFVSPPGIGAFRANDGYAHGGVSLQECVVPDMVVERVVVAQAASIASVEWRRLRCRVTVVGGGGALRVDIRRQWKDGATSLVDDPKLVDGAGIVSLLVPDEGCEGSAAIVVVLDGERVIARQATTVGEGT